MFSPKKSKNGYKCSRIPKLPQSMKDIKSLLDLIRVKKEK
jgi:hypothetical protein